LPGKSPNTDLDNDLSDTDGSDNDDDSKIYTRLGLEQKRVGLSSRKYLAMCAKAAAKEKLRRKEELAKKNERRERDPTHGATALTSKTLRQTRMQRKA
jgi:hypothetical protein